MASGSLNISSGFSLVSQWSGQHFGGPYEVWSGGNYSGVYYAYTSNTEAYVFIIPSAFVPAGEGLTRLLWTVPNSHDGYGIQNAPYIESPTLGTLADPGIGAQAAEWYPSRRLSQAEINDASIRVRLQTWHGGVPNTFARTGTGWLLQWWSDTIPLADITTDPATDVTNTSAQLNGSLNPQGYPVQYWFSWGEGSSFNKSTAVLSSSSSIEIDHDAALTNLVPGITYRFRLAVKNTSTGITTYGETREFTTPPGLVAVV